MNISIISNIVIFLVGLIYTIMALSLPLAPIGNPIEPKVLPVALGIILTILSFGLLIQEVLKQNKQKKETENVEKEKIKLTLDSNSVKIFLTCGISIIYALLFNLLGYVISTILFLEAILWVFNGIKDKKWIINTIISVIFSIFIYVLFTVFLAVSLPGFPELF